MSSPLCVSVQCAWPPNNPKNLRNSVFPASWIFSKQFLFRIMPARRDRHQTVVRVLSGDMVGLFIIAFHARCVPSYCRSHTAQLHSGYWWWWCLPLQLLLSLAVDLIVEGSRLFSVFCLIIVQPAYLCETECVCLEFRSMCARRTGFETHTTMFSYCALKLQNNLWMRQREGEREKERAMGVQL